jgi:ABC-type dipeptide/oligopeptide/nickel transport system permease component/ABC-type transport system substrate-binding protein
MKAAFKQIPLAIVFLMGVGYLFALFFQPQWSPAVKGAEEGGVSGMSQFSEGLRERSSFQYFREVDYSEGEGASWWPRGESPVLATLVAEGALPPVIERVGPEPLVMEGPDGIGNYGGIWLRLATGQQDALNFVTSRLGAPTLFRWSPWGPPVTPHLARAAEASEDFRTWTIHLRRGVRWSDSHPFTATDILFRVEVLQEIDGVLPRYLTRGGNQLLGIELLNDYAIRFSFAEPNPIFLEEIAREARVMLPRHYLERYLPSSPAREFKAAEMRRLDLPNERSLFRDRSSLFNPEQPVLSPWIYPQDQRTAPFNFMRNPYFWAVDTEGNQLPYIDLVQFGERSRQLMSASAYEGAVSMQHRHLKFADYSLLMANRNLHNYEVYHWTDAGTPWVIWPNLNRRVSPDQPSSKWKSQLLNDKRFRQALSLAIDRQEIIEALLSGVGEPSQVAPFPGSPFYDPQLKKAYTDYDMEEANRLLDELGLTKRDREGYRTFPDGTRMTWFLEYGGFIERGATPFVIEYWRNVGLRTIERERSTGLLATERRALVQDFRIWDVFNVPLLEVNAFLPQDSRNSFALAYANWFDRGGMEGSEPGGEGISVQEPSPGSAVRQAMEIYSRALSSIDETERKALFRQVMEIAAEEVWSIAIATPPPVLGVVRDGFRNVLPEGLSGFTFLFPSNLGPETYFFDEPAALSPGANERLAMWLRGGSVQEGSPPRTPVTSGKGGGIISTLFGILLVGGLLFSGLRYPIVGRRFLVLIPTLFVMSVGIFWIIQIPPGDYVQMRIAELEAEGDESAIEQVRELRGLFHLDEPVVMQYVRWTGLYWFVSFKSADTGLLQGNLGRSMETLQSVNDMVGDRLLLTVLISIGTILFTYAMAIPIGIYSAIRQYSPGDYFFTVIGFLGLCMPNFLLALLLMFFSSRYLGIDATGLFSPEYAAQPEWTFGKFVDLLKHIWIPIVVVGTAGTAGMIRIMRGNLLDELRKPYVVTARAKGVRPASLILRYPVRLAINPFISGIGGIFPRLVSGEAIVAIVISLPTVGPLLLVSLLNQDMYVAGSLLMFLSILGVLGTLVSDLLLMAVDPRIRLEQ